MELSLAILVFLVLLAIALAGLAVSSRNARRNDASRHARLGTRTVHPAEQPSRTGAGLSHPTYRDDRLS
jgi:hypothetical protein